MFLLKRSPPLAFQGYFDAFQRGPEFPVRQPWGKWGTVATPYIDGSQQLVLPSTTAGQTGGVSHEFQPFKSSYGMEVYFTWPITGPGDQFFTVFIMPNWSIIGPNFNNTLAVRLFHQPVGTGDTVRIQQWANLNSFSNDVSNNTSPDPLDGSVPYKLKIHVEDDRYIGVWLNDKIATQGMVSAGYQTGPGRRGLNLMQFSTSPAYLQWADLYDRRPSCPGDERWSPTFSDDFNRSDGAVGNGWTQYGSNAGIVSGSFATTGTTDGSRAIIRPTGITSGYQRISGVVGGALGPNNDSASALVLRSNAAGTQAIVANVFGNKVYISRLSGSMTNPSHVDYSSLTSGFTIANGDRLTFSTWDNWAWLEVNGVRRLYATNINAVVPQSNEYAGLRVARAPFADSHSWNAVDIYSGIGY